MLVRIMDEALAESMGYDPDDMLNISKIRKLRDEEFYMDLLGQSTGTYEIRVTKAALYELIRKLDYTQLGGERLWSEVF